MILVISWHSQDGDFVFASRAGTALSHRNVQRRGFEPAAEHAELERVTFHDLRHAFASICAHRGVPVGVVSKVMGHANVAITLSVYTHLFNPDEADEAFRVAMAGAMP